MAEAAEDKKLAPIIVKRIKKGGHGHHGGAWKVAYADFVTAMMAFFLLLWLLSTTTPEQRTGVAEYFTPTVGLKDSRGIGFEGGLTPNEKGTSKSTLTTPGLVAGQVKQGPKPTESSSDTLKVTEQNQGAVLPVPADAKTVKAEEDADTVARQQEEMKKIEEQVMSVFEQSPDLQQLKKNIIITNTPEGVKIDVVDDPERPMFIEGKATMTDTGRIMFKAISGVLANTTNQLSVTGHTESVTYPPGATYTAWELSSDRANSTRRFLGENLVETRRMKKVTGMADKELLLATEPQNPRNRRISVLLLRGTQDIDLKAPPVKDLLSVPEVDTKALKPPPPPPLPKAPEQPLESPVPPPGSIFKEGDKKAEEKSFEAPPEEALPKPQPEDLKPVLPPPPPPKPLEKPVEVPAVPTGSIFKEGDALGKTKGFDAPDKKSMPAIPAEPDKTQPAEQKIEKPVELEAPSSGDSIFSPR